MFETVRPGDGSGNRRRFYGSLPLSLALHALGAGVAIVALTANLTFPIAPPLPTLSYLSIDGGAAIPPSAGSQSAPAAEKPAPASGSDAATATTPRSIAAVPPSATSAAREGVATGVEGGLLLSDGRIHFGRGGLLPVAALAMDYPGYPEDGRRLRLESDVTLRYVVGTDGAVREVTLIEGGLLPSFDTAAIEAVKAWRFEPLIYRGIAREIVHEVIISFRLRH